MDHDRRVVEFDEYGYTIWGTVKMRIEGEDMVQAVERFGLLFDKEFSKDYVCEGMSILNPDNFKDIESVVRIRGGLYEFTAFFETTLTGYNADGEYDEEEATNQIYMESLSETWPEFVIDVEVTDTELEDVEYIDSGYWD